MAEQNAQPVALNNPEVAKVYDCTYTHNPIVHVPGIYRGLLSDVTPQAATAMVAQGHRALVPKPTPTSDTTSDVTISDATTTTEKGKGKGKATE